MYATHSGQFETNAELYFASNAMQTARNTANDSQNRNVGKWTETKTNCEDKNTIRAPSSSIAIWHRFTRTNPRKDKKRTKKHEREKTKTIEILNLERQNKRTNHVTSAFAFPLGVVLREQKQLKISGRRNSQETKKGASGGEESHTPANPIPQRKVIHRINTLTKNKASADQCRRDALEGQNERKRTGQRKEFLSFSLWIRNKKS